MYRAALLAMCLAGGYSAGFAQTLSTVHPQNRIPAEIVEEDRIALTGNVHPLVQLATASSLADGSTELEDLVLVLKPSSEQQNALRKLIAEQSQPGSPNFHRFLTPQQYEKQFGVSTQDIATLRAWLESYGMSVKKVPAGSTSILFRGTVQQVSEAFQTEIRRITVNGEQHLANASEPQIPRAFSAVVNGVLRLHDFHHKALHVVHPETSPPTTVMPAFAPAGVRWLVPGDYYAIYDINPLLSAGIDGTGESIAVLARSDIYLSDVQSFRSLFGLNSNDPSFVVTNSDPGQVNGDNIETTLDTEWAGAVAPGAAIKVIISASTASSDGIELFASYAVFKNIAPIITVSYGSCESAMGSSGLAFFNSLWMQAVAQGQTVLVASGDSGAVGCDSSGASKATHGKGVNGLCSSPYSTCVGGTEFAEGSNPAQYWYPASMGSTVGSAMGYIPETVWNESGTTNGITSIWAGGGGASSVYAKPSWQTGTGVPSDRMRDVPDLSLTAAYHDGYTIVQGGAIGYIFAVSGTSAAAPSLAGIMALVEQKNKTTLGNINPVLYSLASQQSKSGVTVFHDITTGNNTVPGQTGFTATTGYDQASGLGSVDTNLLATLWSTGTASPAKLTVYAAGVTVNRGKSNTTKITTAVNGLNAAATLAVSGVPTGLTATLSSATIASPGSGSVTLTVAASSTLAAGIYTLTVTATSGTQIATTNIDVTVTSPTFILSYGGGMYPQINFGPTSPYTPQPVTLQTQPANGFSSPITFTASGMPAGMTVTFSSTTVSGSTVASTVATFTAASTLKGGSYTVTIQATGGGVTQSVTYSVYVYVMPSCTLTPDQYSASFKAGSGVTFTLSCAATKSSSNIVNLSVTGAPGGVTTKFSSATVSPTGKATLTLSSTSATAAGTYALNVAGSEANGATQTLSLFVAISTPVFSLSLSPATITVYPGYTTTFTAVVTPDSGFTKPVSIWVGGVPNGINRSIGPNSIANPSSIITFAVDKSTAKGTYSLTLGADTTTGFSREVTTSLIVATPPVCTLASSAATLSMAVGKTATAKITCAVTSGTFLSALNLNLTGLPSGVAAQFSPATLTAGYSTTLTLTGSSSAKTGSSTLTLTATGTAFSKSLSLPLTITSK